MDFDQILDQAIEMLQRRRRLTYGTLKRQFDLNDAALQDLKEELLYSQPLVVDDAGRGLLWVGHASAPPDAERRQLTVMFCDLVDSTQLSVQLDPETYRDIVRAYQTVCAEVIKRFEGYIAQYLGDGLLVYFGYPVAHEDDAQRAVRAALGSLAAMQPLNANLAQDQGHQLALRIGIHTGLVVVGEIGAASTQQRLAMGETPNVASRLQNLATPNTVILSEATLRLVQGYFEFQALGEYRLRGTLAPMAVYRVLQESGVQSRLEIAPTLTPLVGREPEVTRLLDHWQQAKAGLGRVVLLNGESGIGKSRLLHAIKDALAEDVYRLIELRCSSYHPNSVLYPIIDLFQRLLHWTPDDTPERRRGKLEAFLIDYALPLDKPVPLLSELLSLPYPAHRYTPLSLEPQKQRQDLLEAILTILLTVAAARPVLLLVEDLQWMDPSTEEFLTLLIEQVPTQRMCALLTYRPTFQVPWPNRSYISQITLSRLPPDEVEKIITHITRGKSLPAEIMSQVVYKTDGIPLFIEEFTKALLEAAPLQEGNDRYELLTPLQTLAIPTTLHDSLMARLDRLHEGKRVAQVGSVIGRQFSYALLQAVWEEDERLLKRGITRLVEAELMYQQGLPSQVTYVFKHALIQEAANQSLLRGTRQHYHQRTAEVLIEQFSETAESQPELLAYHYEMSGLTAPAVHYWQRAGKRALERSAYVEAIRHLQRGLALLPSLEETDTQALQELAMQIDIGRAFMAIKGYGAPEVAEAYNRAQVLCLQLPGTPRLFAILRGLAAYYLIRAEYATTRELGEGCLKLAKQFDDPVLLLRASLTLGQTHLFLGNLTQAHEHFNYGISKVLSPPQGERIIRAIQDPHVTCLALDAITLWMLGYPEQTSQRSLQAIRLAQELKHPFSLAEALIFATLVSIEVRDFAEVERRALNVIALADEHDFPHWRAHAQVYYGRALAMRGQVEAGIAQIKSGLDQWEAIGGILARAWLLSHLGEAYRLDGQIEKALAIITDALHLADAHDERHYESELYRLKGEFLLQQHAANQATEAEACFQRALEIASVQQAKGFELRARMSLCTLWQQQCKPDSAYRVLEEGYSWFTEGFQTADLLAARALLAELGDQHT
jgi:class 3 adenylate cyclase/predicted ATPase